MKILVLEKEVPGVDAGRYKPHLKAEAARVWQLQQEGVIREIYFRADEASAVIILECSDTDEAREILNTLPLVKEGLISFELIPLKAYPGFERLFEQRM